MAAQFHQIEIFFVLFILDTSLQNSALQIWQTQTIQKQMTKNIL